MSQNQAADYSIDPFTTSGQQLAAILNRLHDAGITTHSGAARPPYAKAGTIWLDTSTAPGVLKWYDGTVDHEIGGDALPAGGTTGQVLAKQSATDGDVDWNDPPEGGVSGYDDTASYLEDDLIYHDGKLLRAKAAIPGPAGTFDPDQWTQITDDVVNKENILTGIYVTGDIDGLEYVITGANEVTVKVGMCKDSTNSVPLILKSDTPVTIGTTINQIYNLFICKDTSTGAISIETDTDVDGANLPANVTHKRWLGFVRTNSSGNIVQFVMSGDMIMFSKDSEAKIQDATGTKTVIGLSVLAPESRIREVLYGIKDSSGADASRAIDFYDGNGTDLFMKITTNSGYGNVWEGSAGQTMHGSNHWIPHESGRYKISGSTTADLLLRGVRLKR